MPAQGREIPPAVPGTEDRPHRGRRRAAVAGGAVALFAIGGLGGLAISQAAEGATTDTGGRGFPSGVGGGTTDDGALPT
jgi:hypothetical protein